MQAHPLRRIPLTLSAARVARQPSQEVLLPNEVVALSSPAARDMKHALGSGWHHLPSRQQR